MPPTPGDPASASPASRVSVTSEVGRLRRVLVHEPGPEIDRMVPAMMEELLFDDILHGEFARDEHRRFRRVLQLLGVEVLEAGVLLAETLAASDGRAWVLDRVLPRLRPEFRDRVAAASPDGLAELLVEGMRSADGASAPATADLFGVRPLPNWCFQRDTQVVLGEGVVLATMASRARAREALLSRTIFGFHPRFAGVPIVHDPGAWGEEPARGGRVDRTRTVLEGGDVLVLSPDVVAVGHSERTTEAGIAALARALHRRDGGPRWLLRVELPRTRAFMHLDTIFTPVDRDAALVFAPVILGTGSGGPGSGAPDAAQTLVFDLHAADVDAPPEPAGDLLGALRERGVDLEPIPCGGDDPIDQQREQWTDGANAFAVAPGVVVLYDRNVRTAEAMERRGFRVVRADDLLLGSAEVSLDGGERVCILTPSNELSRARGGPHCLTHPLERDPV